MQRSATSSLIEGPPRATGNIRRLVIGGLGTVRWQLPRLKPGDCQWREKVTKLKKISAEPDSERRGALLHLPVANELDLGTRKECRVPNEARRAAAKYCAERARPLRIKPGP
jgi:hypothetical protein